MAESIVRKNLMSRPGYTPYCGALDCRFRMPRTKFDGDQFSCMCGWRSGFEAEFIEAYKEKNSEAAAFHRRVAANVLGPWDKH